MSILPVIACVICEILSLSSHALYYSWNLIMKRLFQIWRILILRLSHATSAINLYIYRNNVPSLFNWVLTCQYFLYFQVSILKHTSKEDLYDIFSDCNYFNRNICTEWPLKTFPTLDMTVIFRIWLLWPYWRCSCDKKLHVVVMIYLVINFMTLLLIIFQVSQGSS